MIISWHTNGQSRADRIACDSFAKPQQNVTVQLITGSKLLLFRELAQQLHSTAQLQYSHTLLKWSFAMLGTVLLVILILMLLGALPVWPHARNWGAYPSGGLGLIVLIIIILLLLGRI